MFLRSTSRKKNGKEHRYFSIVENKRWPTGESCNGTCCISVRSTSRKQLAWRKSIEVFEEGSDAAADPGAVSRRSL